jgi:hypothetical protein
MTSIDFSQLEDFHFQPILSKFDFIFCALSSWLYPLLTRLNSA